MKRILGGTLVGALALAATTTVKTADAQIVPSAKPISLGVAGGLSVPIGNYNNIANNGFALQGSLSINNPGFVFMTGYPTAVRIDLLYNRNGQQNVNDAHFSQFGGMANGVVSFPSGGATTGAVTPYALAGLGVVSSRYSITRGSVTTTNNDTGLGFDFGGGLMFNLTGLTAFAEARFQTAFVAGQNPNTIPIVFGVMF